MVSVDLRTRSQKDERPVAPSTFFSEELPSLIDRHAHLAVPGAQELHPRPFSLDVEGEAWTLSLDDGKLHFAPGADGVAHAVLDAEEFSDLICDVRTPMGFFTGGDLDMPRGRLEDFLDWWVILRSLIDGRAAYTRGSISFDGVDLDRTFQPDDPAEEMAAFLTTAGYLHIGGVFSTDEMDAVSREIDAALPSYQPDDGRSWWARTESGEHRAVRLQYFQECSPTTAALLRDDRLRRLAAITDDGFTAGEDHLGFNVIEALVKPIGVVEGISDVPWHKDCSLGRHSYRCCSLTVGISVTGADATSGQLRVVAGSHRALIQPAFVRRGLDLPQVDLPTATGDITVHLSCTLHMSQPPVTRERRVMYTGFSLPSPTGYRDDKLGRIREEAYKKVSQTASTSSAVSTQSSN